MTESESDMKSKVVILYCDTYEKETVYRKLRTAVELLGGTEAVAGKQEKLLLKPNLVRKAEVDRAVITHPSVVEAAARIFREDGYRRIGCGDSCGVGSARKVMEGTGMDRALEKYGIVTEDFGEGVMISNSQGHIAREFFLARPVVEADALINLCKMKTHALERVTGGVKNLYGCISGLQKAKGHTKYSNADSFARMLVDLNQRIKPRLCIMDGIVAMEGNGPTSGDPTAMNLLLVSMDPVALDSVFCRLVHLDPELVPTNVHGERMGLGTWREENITLLGEDGPLTMGEAVERYGRPGFRVDRRKRRTTMWNRLDGLMRPFQRRPYILRDNCRKCGVCVETCPVEGKALNFSNGRSEPPVYDYKKCIRCFCCQEMCPFQAIDVSCGIHRKML